MKQHLFLMLLALNTGVHGEGQSTGKPDTSWVEDLRDPATKKAVQRALALQGSTIPQWDKPSVPVAFKGHIIKDAPSVPDTALMPGRDLYIGWINDLLKKQSITQSEADFFGVPESGLDSAVQQIVFIFDHLASGLNTHVTRLPVPVVVHNKDGLLEPKDMVMGALQGCAFIGVPSDLHPEWHPADVRGEGQTRFTSSGFTIHDLSHSLVGVTVLNDTVGQAMRNVVKQADTTTAEGKKAVMPLFWLLHETNGTGIVPRYNPQAQYFAGHVLQELCKEWGEKGRLDRSKERTGPAGSTYTLDGLAADINNTFEKMGEKEKNTRQKMMREKRDLKDIIQMSVKNFDKERQRLKGLRAILMGKKVTQDTIDTVKTKLDLCGEHNAKDLRKRVEKALKTVGARRKLKIDDVKKSMGKIDAQLKQTLADFVRERAQLKNFHAIVTAQNINVIKERHKTYTTDPHVYVDSLFDPLIAASKGSDLRDDTQQLDAMIGWVDPALCQKKDKGTDKETYDNWGTFAQWATECKANLHDEINKIRQTKETAPTDQVADV